MTALTVNKPGVKVLRLQEAHIDGIIALMNKEGWYYYDHRELQRYLDLNQECFTIMDGGRIAGSIFTTNYGTQAWIGNIVVAEETRGRGLATESIRAVITHLHKNRHVRTVRLGSVPLAIGLYKRVGFHAEAFTTAQEAALPLPVEPEEIPMDETIRVERLDANDLAAVGDLDARFFKAMRLQFLKKVYEDSIKESCFCLKNQDRLVGFLMLRRRQASKEQGRFAEGPDYAYRLGPSCVLPAYGINGFKALFREAIRAVNKEVRRLRGSARMYAVFPKQGDKEKIYKDTRQIATAMGMDTDLNLDSVFDEHDHIFGASRSRKNEEQWEYMEHLGFHQEYFEQVMSHTPGEAVNREPHRRTAEETRADTEGIFAAATPGDKA